MEPRRIPATEYSYENPMSSKSNLKGSAAAKSEVKALSRVSSFKSKI
jgi:hypothetical protein